MGNVIFCGIDPGLTGAIALLNPEINEVRFYDAPTLEIITNKKRKNILDAYAMTRIMRDINLKASVAHMEVWVTIEKVQAMPGGGERTMGATSAFNFGMGFGMWLGILAALEIPHQQVHPATWKAKIMAGMGKEKDASRQVAMQHYPKAAPDLNLKKHHGRADALMLARYGWVTYGGQPAKPQGGGLFD